ncbi:MAG: hypothetical protein DRJ05_20460 [Bacteroidetes bacterium]|nr:MAG: hypothetical protein DRJ05_20460 [Bacteroidota bacterium]
MKKLILFAAVLLTANMLFGQINKIDTSFYSEALGEEKMVDVYFPPGYDENPELYYPVIYCLPAWKSNQNEMSLYYLNSLQSHINDSLIDPVIMVCANNNPPPFQGNMYVNSELWGNYEDYNVYDLIEWVESSFRAIPLRDARGLFGQSMGSHGSFRYGILYKDKFRALAAHAGIVSLDKGLWLESSRQQVILENPSGPPYFYNYSSGGVTAGLFLVSGAFSPDTNSPQTYINPQVVNYLLDENADYIDSVYQKFLDYDITLMIQQLTPEDNVGILFGCGVNDEFLLYPANLALTDTLAMLGLPFEFYSHNGGHGMPTGFRNRAFIFLDSLLMPPGIYNGTHQPTHQKIRFSMQNYPNPFDQRITIELTFREKSEITVSIYNQLGGKVATIFEGSKEKGIHQLTWNSENISPGIYFIKLQTDIGSTTQKIIKR